MDPVTSRGPLNQVASPRLVRDGTTPPRNGVVPGPQCTTRPTGIRDYTRRVGNVKDAFLLGIGKYAYKETLARLGDDAKLIVNSLWPGFIQALEIYAWSIGGGAVVFGLAGGLLGEGFGAFPGALLGARIGAQVATYILTFLGLKFLAEYVLSHMDRANVHFGRGCQEAWTACGDRPALDHAASEIGRGVAEIFSLVLEAAVVWVLKKGLKAGMDELGKSKAGRALAPYVKIQYWREKLGVTDAPIPRQGIARTIEFFEDQARKGHLKPLDESKLLSYWKAMDFSKEIKPETLKAGKELVAYRDPQSPFGFFYTEPGTYINRLGIDHVTLRNLPKGIEGPPTPIPREFFRYRVLRDVEVLRSTSSGVRAFDTKQPVPGGGTQYFIPRSWEVLEVVDQPKAKPPLIVPKNPETPPHKKK